MSMHERGCTWPSDPCSCRVSEERAIHVTGYQEGRKDERQFLLTKGYLSQGQVEAVKAEAVRQERERIKTRLGQIVSTNTGLYWHRVIGREDWERFWQELEGGNDEQKGNQVQEVQEDNHGQENNQETPV